MRAFRACRSVPCGQYPSRPRNFRREKLSLNRSILLEAELQRELDQPRVMNVLHLSKRAARIRNVAVHAVELRVVPDVEDVAAELHVPSLTETGFLHETHIPIVDARTAADGTRSVSDGARRHGCVGEQSRIKHEAVIFANVLRVKRSGEVWFTGSLEQESGIQFFHVIRRGDADWETALEGHDSREFPAIQEFALKAVELWNREVPNIVEYKTIARIVGREAVGGVEVERIQSTLKAGGIVHGFAKGVGGLKLQTFGEVFLDQNLQGIVVRLGDGVFREDTRKHGGSVGRAAYSRQGLAEWGRKLAQAYQSNRIGKDAGGHRQSSASGIVGQRKATGRNHRARRNGVSGIFAERAASAGTENGVELIASGWITDIYFIAGQQAVPLRSYVTDLEKDIPWQLAFQGQVVLVGILQAQVGGKLAEEGHRSELRPIHRLATRRIQDAIERIRKHIAALVDVGSLQERIRDEIAAAKWRLSAELLENELLDRVIENAITHADAGLAGATRQGPQQSLLPVRAPIEA